MSKRLTLQGKDVLVTTWPYQQDGVWHQAELKIGFSVQPEFYIDGVKLRVDPGNVALIRIPG